MKEMDDYFGDMYGMICGKLPCASIAYNY
jgi:hypothetical protein